MSSCLDRFFATSTILEAASILAIFYFLNSIVLSRLFARDEPAAAPQNTAPATPSAHPGFINPKSLPRSQLRRPLDWFSLVPVQRRDRHIEFLCKNVAHCVDLDMVLHTRSSLLEIRSLLFNLRQLFGDYSTNRSSGKTTFGFVNGPDSFGLGEAVDTGLGTLVVRHNRPHWNLNYRFAFVERSLRDTICAAYASQHYTDLPFDNMEIKAANGEQTVAALIKTLTRQGAVLENQLEGKSHSTLQTPSTTGRSPPQRLLSATIPLPFMQQFAIAGTLPPNRELYLQPNELYNLPFAQLTSISVTKFTVSYDDFCSLLGRCHQVQRFTLHQICKVSNVSGLLPPKSRPGEQLELPYLESLMLTSRIGLKRFFSTIETPHLNLLELTLLEPVQECSPAHYNITWSNLERGFTLRGGELSNGDIRFLRHNLQNKDWVPMTAV